MNSRSPFKWHHFLPDIILGGVRWYCLYPISYRNLSQMMCEREVEVDRSKLDRWLQRYAPQLDKQCRRHLKPTNDSWRVNQTDIKVKGKDKYLYRAVDSQGNTLECLLSAKTDATAAEGFFRKTFALILKHHESLTATHQTRDMRL